MSTTNTETLRRAAARLRGAADKCCQCTDGHHDWTSVYGTEGDVRMSRDAARAAAKAMDDVAQAWEIADEANAGWVYDPDDDPIRFEDTIDAGWLAVARALLGEDQ